MNLRVVALGIISVAVVDTAGAFASRTLGFPYTYLSIASAAIYFVVGFIAYRTKNWEAATAAFWVSLFDVTVGWYISAVIGPGRIEGSGVSRSLLVGCSAVVVVLLSVGIGLLGGLLKSRMLARRPATPN